MSTQSTHTKHKRQRGYATGSLRGRHSAVTLRDQVADIERGIRIRERREELHLTQPAVVQLLEEAASRLPEDHDLHPARAGKAPVTLRGYQSYEQGGGIVWEKAKLLAQVLQLEVQAMMSGEPEDTPDPFAAAHDPQAEWMTRMEALIDRQNDLLERQSLILERIEARLEATVEQETRAADHIEAATGSLDQSAADLDAAVRRTISGLESAPRSKRPAAKKTATHRTARP
jgi:transcriptional regulator with XRE-family HTH domain